jgi:hypothetical protein
MRGRHTVELTCSLCGHRGSYKQFTRYDYDGDKICIKCQIELFKERHARQRALPYYLKDTDSHYSNQFETAMRQRDPKTWGDTSIPHHIPEWGVREEG